MTWFSGTSGEKEGAGEKGRISPWTQMALYISDQIRQGQQFISLVLQLSSFLCFLIRTPHTPLVFGVQGPITFNYSLSLSCVNLGGFFHTSVLPKGGVGREWCCLWCNFNTWWSERVNEKGWRARNHFFKMTMESNIFSFWHYCFLYKFKARCSNLWFIILSRGAC